MNKPIKKWQAYDVNGSLQKADDTDLTEKELEEVDAYLQSKGLLFSGAVQPFRFTDDGETLDIEPHTGDEKLVISRITTPKGDS